MKKEKKGKKRKNEKEVDTIRRPLFSNEILGCVVWTGSLVIWRTDEILDV